ncbi:MAG: NADH dehydrogenase subunit [Bacteroidota bacterium]|nr:NADH dehydrogenase subunit [Bacteroidota bacterium]
MSSFITTSNNTRIPLDNIPVVPYSDFLRANVEVVRDVNYHCVQYFGFIHRGRLKLVSCIANDATASILISSTEINPDTDEGFPSFTAHEMQFHLFERILHEKFAIKYSDHPWLKPVRYPFDRAEMSNRIENYPFYHIDSEELHEVGVGPIHAGTIEPGHFRFICNGEQILHLEIQRGYQHRGIEQLFLTKKNLLQRTLLAESISGDAVAGHTTAFVNLWEALCGFEAPAEIRFARTVALELERIAVHTGDLSAICTDIGYQLGSAVFGRLRTPIINFLQEWCGNRLGKSLIRVANNPWPFSRTLASRLESIFLDYEKDFDEMWREFHKLPSALARLEKTGVLSRDLAVSLGTVGPTARSSGLMRDIRATHPHGIYHQFSPIAIVKHHGDVYSRARLRHDEIVQSIYYLRRIIRKPPEPATAPVAIGKPAPDTFAIALTEGWRGEICHCAITNEKGELSELRIKDPSMHNWMALALAVRNNEISDFPICNKSFNLSYSGHDL